MQHTFGLSHDIQLLIAIISTARTVKSYLINVIQRLFTDVAATNIHHEPRCSSIADIQFIQRDLK